jgi:hypothetical protein
MTEWRRVADSNVEVCSDGRVRRDGVEFVPCIGSNGYRMIRVNYKTYCLHKLVAMSFIPNIYDKPEIDHINGDKLDNRVENLRWATKSENQFNKLTHKKSSLPRGVVSKRNRFQTQIKYDNKRLYLGCYDTPEEASVVYEARAKELFGEFYRESS